MFGQHFLVGGGLPFDGLVQGVDGNLYGTTTTAGSSNKGTVFKITPAGTLTTLHSFAGGTTDGNGPSAGLVPGSDGNFYGVTFLGGTNNNGTVFKITPSGTLTTLYSFTGGADGGRSTVALVQGNDGNFYGTTPYGGSGSTGTVFKITPTGVLTTLYSFSTNGNNGVAASALVLGSDGNFYGTTNRGGKFATPTTSGYGTAFRISPSGSLCSPTL
ncbi:choice-of-anchor tandem repeat GloVer-containing protein [Stenotrophobium rhamnosiphilum]|uniref:choice-of-anchor tandem repeat GloVer-containing protein n=1 Tax=Stenotrophobium rhamnosiphilum TaxID=2029166 RepID=UPI0013749EB4|nr:choice-of-anchor tandem repeat GloVer-containing protein [Stenotrophobium rhamnosiphilum]